MRIRDAAERVPGLRFDGMVEATESDRTPTRIGLGLTEYGRAHHGVAQQPPPRSRVTLPSRTAGRGQRRATSQRAKTFPLARLSEL